MRRLSSMFPKVSPTTSGPETMSHMLRGRAPSRMAEEKSAANRMHRPVPRMSSELDTGRFRPCSLPRVSIGSRDSRRSRASTRARVTSPQSMPTDAAIMSMSITDCIGRAGAKLQSGIGDFPSFAACPMRPTWGSLSMSIRSLRHVRKLPKKAKVAVLRTSRPSPRSGGVAGSHRGTRRSYSARPGRVDQATPTVIIHRVAHPARVDRPTQRG